MTVDGPGAHSQPADEAASAAEEERAEAGAAEAIVAMAVEEEAAAVRSRWDQSRAMALFTRYRESL